MNLTFFGLTRNLKGVEANARTMARALAKARKIGGSMMVVIPREVVEQEDIREGELIELEVRRARKSWFGATPGISPFAHEDEGDEAFDRK